MDFFSRIVIRLLGVFMGLVRIIVSCLSIDEDCLAC